MTEATQEFDENAHKHFAGRDPEKFRYAKVPILPEELKEYFVDKDITFMVDYAESRFKGMTFLTYLSNIGVPTDVIFTEKFDKEMYFELMKAYMTQRMVSYSENISVHLAQLLLLAKGVPYEKIPFRTKIEPEVMFEFMVENQDIVLNWMHFLDSTIVLYANSIPALKEKMKPEELPVIDDKEFVGHNVVVLYNVPGFMSAYFGESDMPLRLSYFKKQFEDYMFANRRLIEYAVSTNNVFGMALEGMASGEIDVSNPQAFINKLIEMGENKNAGNSSPSENG